MASDVSTLTTRRHQMFPILDAQELQRVRRFGEPRNFEPGDSLATAGRRSEGMMVILSGEVRVFLLFIGAEPNSAWLTNAAVALDGRGFVLTGDDPTRGTLETSQRGVFAVGDIRSRSTKRVASAVGDGAQVIANLHQYLSTQALARSEPAGA